MKISIVGYSGSGKSTLAKKLGTFYDCDVLHLDSVHFGANWVEKSDEEMIAQVKPFLEKDNWVIDGNYSRILYRERMEQADRILILKFNRFASLWRAYKRYRTYKGTTRSDMAPGCNEKFDLEFVCWILWNGRSKKARDRYQGIATAYPEKTVIIKNQRQLDRFVDGLK